jgi:hypothetical protein
MLPTLIPRGHKVPRVPSGIKQSLQIDLLKQTLTLSLRVNKNFSPALDMKFCKKWNRVSKGLRPTANFGYWYLRFAIAKNRKVRPLTGPCFWRMPNVGSLVMQNRRCPTKNKKWLPGENFTAVIRRCADQTPRYTTAVNLEALCSWHNSSQISKTCQVLLVYAIQIYFWPNKIPYMIEAESDFRRHKSNRPPLMKGKDWTNWQWLLFLLIPFRCGGPSSSVSIVTGYRLDGPGIESQWVCNFSHTSRPALGSTQPPVQWVPGFPSNRKQPGRDADPSPPSGAEVQKTE